MYQESSPKLSQDLVQRSIAGLRPYRKTGVRIEAEQIEGKSVIHNYGHGGAGITMCWGSAMEVADLAKKVPNTKGLCVLGGGVIGLTAALVLHQCGYAVRVCSENFTPNTTSDVAGGRWAPTLVEIGESQSQQAMFARILQRTLDKFLELLNQPYGVSWRKSYVESGTDTSFCKIPAGLLPPKDHLTELPFKSVSAAGDLHRTLLIEPPIFMPKLMDDCAQAGITLEQRRLNSTTEFATIPETLIINCTGLGARALFADEELVPIRGQLVLVQAQENLPWLLSHQRGYVFPRQDALVLGGTVEIDEFEPTATPEGIAAILQGNREFFGLENQ